MVPCSNLKKQGDRNNFLDLQRTRLEIEARIVQNNGNVLRTHATEVAQRDNPNLVNNPLLSLFSECTMSLSGDKISTTNVNFAHKSFIETEFSLLMMQRKHGLLVKVIYMNIIYKVLMVLMGELKMSRNVSELFLVKLPVTFYHVTNILSAAFLWDDLLMTLLSCPSIEINITELKSLRLTYMCAKWQ